jgi:hypothetical protein
VPRQPLFPHLAKGAQGIGGHLLCSGSSKGGPPCRRRRASHLAPKPLARGPREFLSSLLGGKREKAATGERPWDA